MPQTIVTDRCLHDVRTRLGIPADGIHRTDAGLSRVEISESDLDLLSDVDGILIDPAVKILVDGQPMDVHGDGVPLPSRFELPDRLPAANSGQQAPATELGTGEGVLIGVVDTGILPNAWLNGGYLAAPSDFEIQFTAEVGRDPKQLEYGHGTFATGLILQQAPAAGVWVERVLDPTGQANLSRVVEAAVALARRGVDVLNLSLGAFAPNEPNAKAVMTDLVQHLLQISEDRGKPLAIVAAAGNLEAGNKPSEFWPAALPNVLAVGAVERPDSAKLATWSNAGEWLDLAAPGKDLLSTYIDGELPVGSLPKPIPYQGWALWSGTSFATAVVSGAIAQLMSTRPAGQISAVAAANCLRAGRMATGWTDLDGDVPAVPIVQLRTWDKQQAARNAGRKTSELLKMLKAQQAALAAQASGVLNGDVELRID